VVNGSQHQPDEGATGGSVDGSQIAVIGKAAQVLEALLHRPEGAAPTQVAADLAINRSTAFRLLTSLERSRLVDRDPETGRYRLGLRFLTFGDAVRARIDVVSIADPVLRQLRDEVRLTVYLAIRNEWGAVCLKRLAGPDFDVLAWKPGQQLPFHRGAGPRALLAALPDAELEVYLAEPMDRSTRSGMLAVDQVRQMVAITRERGWSLNAEDLTPGVSSVGVALRDVNGSAQYAISVAGLAARFQGSSLVDTADAVVAAVSRVAAQIDGGR
jgi:DNA-binding IclR family transcriptional regulator